MSEEQRHLLQKHKILPEFDIVSQTSLKDFMNTYQNVANTSDDIKELGKISKLLSADNHEIPGYENDVKLNNNDNPELNKTAYAIIEFMMKKTTDQNDWAYILMYIIGKLNLELSDPDDPVDE
jgi:hypothetical protein